MLKLPSRRSLAPSALVAAIAVAAGCGDETTKTDVAADPAPPPAATPMASYSGPGSNWNYDLLDDGTFRVARSDFPGTDSDLSISGTYQATATGFLQMTVDGSSGADAPPVGTDLWAVEVPGHVLLLSPAASSSEHMVPMVYGGRCTGSDFGANWINIRARLGSDAASPSGNYFGAYNFTIADGNSQFSSSYALADGFPAQESFSLGNGYCRDGVITTPASDIHISDSGSAVANAFAADPDGGFFVLAMPKKTVASISDFDGNYIGVATDEASQSGQLASPVSVTCSGGFCTGDLVVDVASGATAGQPFTIDLFGTINEPSHGFSTGRFDSAGSGGNIACMLDNDVMGSGQRMISCASQSPSRSYALFSLVLASTD